MEGSYTEDGTMGPDRKLKQALFEIHGNVQTIKRRRYADGCTEYKIVEGSIPICSRQRLLESTSDSDEATKGQRSRVE